MKTIYPTILLALCLTTTAASGQDWFANDHIRTYLMAGGFAGVQDYFNLEVEKDTSVNGQACKKLIVTNTDYSILPSPRYAYADNNRVYAYQSQADSFVVIYDFNLGPGSTLFIPNEYDGFQYTIEAVDTVQVGSQTRRRQKATAMHYGNPTGWKFDILEEIGAVGRPFESAQPECSYFFMDEAPYCYSAVDGFDLKFICSLSNQGVFSPFGLNCIVLDTDRPAAGGQLQVYPNPATTTLNLDPAYFQKPVKQLEILTAEGSLVRNITGQPDQINLSGLPAGLYILTLQMESGQRLSGRFVKQ